MLWAKLLLYCLSVLKACPLPLSSHTPTIRSIIFWGMPPLSDHLQMLTPTLFGPVQKLAHLEYIYFPLQFFFSKVGVSLDFPLLLSLILFKNIQEEFEDIKRVIRIRYSKEDRKYNSETKKGQTTIYKTQLEYITHHISTFIQ